MLLKLELENWASFRDRSTFSCVATRERQHRERLPRVEKFRLSILPVAGIFGGNASGKTNLLKSLAFAKRFVVEGTRPDAAIPVRSFLLDPSTASAPTLMRFELLIDDWVYDYHFAVDNKQVLSESVTRITSSSETVLYERNGSSFTFDETIRTRSDEE